MDYSFYVNQICFPLFWFYSSHNTMQIVVESKSSLLLNISKVHVVPNVLSYEISCVSNLILLSNMLFMNKQYNMNYRIKVNKCLA